VLRWAGHRCCRRRCRRRRGRAAGGSGRASGRSRMALSRVKMEVLAPMPRASESRATRVKPGLLARPRMPRRMSWRVLSRLDSQREDQTWCLTELRLPISALAARRAASGVMPELLLVGGGGFEVGPALLRARGRSAVWKRDLRPEIRFMFLPLAGARACSELPPQRRVCRWGPQLQVSFGLKTSDGAPKLGVKAPSGLRGPSVKTKSESLKPGPIQSVGPSPGAPKRCSIWCFFGFVALRMTFLPDENGCCLVAA
jgi:hypothetical protein